VVLQVIFCNSLPGPKKDLEHSDQLINDCTKFGSRLGGGCKFFGGRGVGRIPLPKQKMRVIHSVYSRRVLVALQWFWCVGRSVQHGGVTCRRFREILLEYVARFTRCQCYDKVISLCRVVYEWNEYNTLQSDMTCLFQYLQSLRTGVLVARTADSVLIAVGRGLDHCGQALWPVQQVSDWPV